MRSVSENLEILPAKNQLQLYGYEYYFNTFAKLFKSNNLPNTILLTGQKGSGKSTFLYHFINFLLSNDISGVSYFNYSSRDGFGLSRTYFTYKKDISDELSFKFQTDVGAVGDDDRWTAYLKKAQLDWTIDEGMKISMGLIGMNMFNVQEKTWGNRFVSKTAIDINKWSSSADLGFSITKNFGIVTANLMMTNGEGYKNMDVDDDDKISLQLLHGEKRLDKNDGYNVGFIYSNLTKDSAIGTDDITTWVECTSEDITAGNCANGDSGWWHTEDGIPPTLGYDTDVMGLFGGWSSNNITTGIEYNTKEEGDVSSSLTSLYANYSINESSSLFVRMDSLDPNIDTNADGTDTLMAGFIWTPTKGLKICPNMVKVGDGDETYKMNFEFKF